MERVRYLEGERGRREAGEQEVRARGRPTGGWPRRGRDGGDRARPLGERREGEN